MILQFIMRKRLAGDSRFTLLRILWCKYVKTELNNPAYFSKQFSLSIHPYFYRFSKGLCEFRVTVFGLNLHYRDSGMRANNVVAKFERVKDSYDI
jgi:hypothetical protein